MRWWNSHKHQSWIDGVLVTSRQRHDCYSKTLLHPCSLAKATVLFSVLSFLGQMSQHLRSGLMIPIEFSVYLHKLGSIRNTLDHSLGIHLFFFHFILKELRRKQRERGGTLCPNQKSVNPPQIRLSLWFQEKELLLGCEG